MASSRSARPSLLCAGCLFYPTLLVLLLPPSSSFLPPPRPPPPVFSGCAGTTYCLYGVSLWWRGATLKCNNRNKTAAGPAGLSHPRDQKDFSRSPNSCVLSAVFCWYDFVSGSEDVRADHADALSLSVASGGLQMWVRVDGSAFSPTDHSKRTLLSLCWRSSIPLERQNTAPVLSENILTPCLPSSSSTASCCHHFFSLSFLFLIVSPKLLY